MDDLSKAILNYIFLNPELSSKEIHDGLKVDTSYSTLKRTLNKLSNNYVRTIGKGKGTRYVIKSFYSLMMSVELEEYYKYDIDERDIHKTFNFELLETILPEVELFDDEELNKLNSLQKTFQRHISELSKTEYDKEMERLAIDLSWKSSQIEGNTYSLLETERLLKEKQTADGKTKDEAVMLLNHKEAIDFILANSDFFNPLSVSKIEDIHSLLIKELGVARNLRTRRVGISGTNYNPLENEFQIREALESTCEIVENSENVFEKALLLLVLISYIQPFSDGNKRTARIVSNAILLQNSYCPLSFRTVDSIEYKKAMLLFYEQNNMSAMKKIFIEQFEFAVNTYF